MGDCELMKMIGGLVNGDSDGGLEGGETKAWVMVGFANLSLIDQLDWVAHLSWLIFKKDSN